MKNSFIAIVLTTLLFSCQNKAQDKVSSRCINNKLWLKRTIYQFKVKDLYGDDFDFSTLKERKLWL